MTKEEFIVQEYGEHWEGFNDTTKQCALKHNGWISLLLEHRLQDIETEYSDEYKAWRPKSLNGIEDNNGWNATSEDKYPEDNETVFWYNIDNGDFETASICDCDFNEKDYTHWYKLPPKPPIY